MDYNDFELAAFWVLCFAAAVPLVILGVLVHLRCGARARRWYVFLGCLASIIYGLFVAVVSTSLVSIWVRSGRGRKLASAQLPTP